MTVLGALGSLIIALLPLLASNDNGADARTSPLGCSDPAMTRTPRPSPVYADFPTPVPQDRKALVGLRGAASLAVVTNGAQGATSSPEVPKPGMTIYLACRTTDGLLKVAGTDK